MVKKVENKTEQDYRVKVLNSFLETPHRKMDEYFKLHKEILQNDPEFYGKLAVWYWSNGDVRDHKEVFTTTLISSKFPGHRDAGLAFLREFPPYEVARMAEAYQEHIAKSLPSCFMTELKFYWWERESNKNQLDGTIQHGKKNIHRFLERYRIPHSEYTQKVIFDGQPPEGSVHFNLKQIAKEEDPAKQAQMLIENKIPFKRAVGVIKKMTPTIMLALVEGMSPQEVINSMAMLKKRGALDNPDIKTLVDKKLESAKTNKRVSALKVKDAQKAANLSEADVKKLDEVADKQIKAKGQIKRPTALLVDKSGSLMEAIDVAKRLGTLVSTIMEKDTRLEVIAFDTMPQKIEVSGNTLADWEKAFRHVTAGGQTACGAGLAWLTRKEVLVEQIILITDEGENAAPFFTAAYEEYAKKVGVRPHVVIVRVGTWQRHLEVGCKNAKITADIYEIGKGADKYSFTNLIPMLARKSKLDLLMDVMDETLPTRKPPVVMPQSVRDAVAKAKMEATA